MYILLTLLVASIGGLIILKFKFPAGALIGALIAVSIYNIITFKAIMPLEIRVFTQIISGIFIGTRIKKKDMMILRQSFKPAFLSIVLLFIACITIGIIIHLTTNYSLSTTLFATAPGGLLNTTLMSYEMNANTAVVSVLQVTRLVTVIGIFPILLNLLITKFLTKKQKRSVKDKVLIPSKNSNNLKNLSITLIVGCSFGLLGYLSKIPAGILMLTMIGTALLNVFWQKAYIPKPTKKIAQVFGGALIGSTVTKTSILEMKNLIIPGILMMIGFFTINLLLAYVLHKKCKLDMITALFSCTPGGATTISLMADDFGAKPSVVSTLQILRSICVVVFYPFIIQLIYAFIP